MIVVLKLVTKYKYPDLDATTAYDGNGNIKAMKQWGLKIAGSEVVDELHYGYLERSNKLRVVVDEQDDPQTKLGDFRTSALHPQESTKNLANIASITDYSYDDNGNLVRDYNKDIGNGSNDGIVYNHLNLPREITVRKADGDVKGIITYTYDATGNKLQKKVVDKTVSPEKVTVTDYTSGMVYENNVLQFMGMEEGRIRPTGENTWAYDYMLKDHLGNVRMLLTDEQKVNAYPPATMEVAQRTLEDEVYGNIAATESDLPDDYPIDTYTDPNEKVAKARGDANKFGPSIILKVMAGDKFNLRTTSWYKTASSPDVPVNPLEDLVTALAGSIGGITATHGGPTMTQLTGSGVLSPQVTEFFNDRTYGSGKPKAYVNWILLDEQFRYVEGVSGAEQVGASEAFTIHAFTDKAITKSGYLYIYVSNETPNIDVFFDNLQVTHTRGPILEETHYYPFGLTMSAISAKLLQYGYTENKKKFNKGTELNTDFGIDIYETSFRGYDPQIGRFNQIDKWSDVTDNLSPYVFGSNNPILRNDPLGLTDSSINGANVTPLENVTVTASIKSRKKSIVTSSPNISTATTLPYPVVFATGARGGALGLLAATAIYIGDRAINSPSLQETVESLLMQQEEGMRRWAEATVANIEAILEYLDQFGGEQEVLYELYTAEAGNFPYLKSKRFWKMLNVDEVYLPANATWKYGTTKLKDIIGGPQKYPARYSPGKVPQLLSTELYRGTRLKVYAMQAYYIAAYFVKHGDIPPGNKSNF